MRLSYYTTCKNRLMHLRETLPRNLKDNPDCEFVLIDYTSEDGLADWVRDTLLGEIKSGHLNYYRIDGMKFFNFSHAKNIGATLCGGDIVCSLDADNFAPAGFADHLLQLFNEPGVFSSPPRHKSYGLWGRLVCTKKDFLKVKGYNEALKGGGYEDEDFRSRLKATGLKSREWSPVYGELIVHAPEIRTETFEEKDIEKSHEENQRVAKATFSHVNANGWGRATVVKNFGYKLVLSAGQVLPAGVFL